jgi:predicted phage terminase large subunit-like protein|tara:strand:- start:2622 stop:4082 length:1461 start_codon:yes stop_codon:yes gene_type:complete
MLVETPAITDRRLKLELRLAQLKEVQTCRDDFLQYTTKVWPEFIAGAHHKMIAKKFEDIATGKIKRLIINMPPRHTKSEFASYIFPSWIIGREPKTKIIQTTHTAELAVNFGRKVRNLIDSDMYQTIFDGVDLQADSKAAGRWSTNHGGEYFAAGVGGAITGRGADLLIIDDPHSEQDALSETAMEHAYEWYTSGPRQRLQPGGAIVIVMTRWSLKDLTAKVIKAQGYDKHSDQWEVVEFPAIMPSGKACWPEFWKLEELKGVQASLSVGKWNAQWQQNPTSEEGAIIKKEWWQCWEEDEVPQLEYVIQSYDTAFSKKETADYSAITTWGVFYPKEEGPPNLILLDCKKGRWDFPELKEEAFEQYKFWEPETVIIEAKASGTPLTQELRQLGIPVVNFTPSKGNDKITRVHSVSPLFESGMIWAPDERWADEVIEECAAFPYGEHDDLVDSTTQALMRYRQGNFVQLPNDDWVDIESSTEVRAYYG